MNKDEKSVPGVSEHGGLRFVAACAPGILFLIPLSIWILAEIARKDPSWGVFSWVAYLIFVLPVALLFLVIGAGLTAMLQRKVADCFWIGLTIGAAISIYLVLYFRSSPG